VTPEGARLQSFLDRSIADLSPHERSESMRGMQRLAHLTEALTKSIDAKADAVADRIQKAHARGEAAITQFEGYATDVEKTADQIEAALGQISNGPTQEASKDSVPSPEK
jgi:seryl-tRNA synthetase